MIEIIITLLIIAIISNVVVNDLEPLDYIKEKIGFGKKRKLRSGWLLLDWIFYLIHHILNCSPCLSYWLTILYFYFFLNTASGFYLGFITYLMAYIIYKKIYTISL